MAIQILKISEIPEPERTPLVVTLFETITILKDEIQLLKDEIARLKGLKPKPQIKPSKIDKPEPKPKSSDSKRPGSEKRSKTAQIEIHETKIIPPEIIPEGSIFKGHQDFTVQDIIFRSHNVLYKLERWETPDGRSIVGRLPAELSGSHYGVDLQGFIIYQYYHGHVTQPLLLEHLHEIGIDISPGQLNNILIEDKESYHQEKEDILEAGLEVSSYFQTDDTTARHNGKNGVCTYIGNDLFAYYASTDSKSRINFLQLLRCGYTDYVINMDALIYMGSQGLAKFQLDKLIALLPSTFDDLDQWNAKLNELGIISQRHVQIATEGALLGSAIEHGLSRDMVIISDDAGQFNILNHALCWVHGERTIQKLVGYRDKDIEAIETVRDQVWKLYADLKNYKEAPDEQKRAGIDSRFDEIFTQKTCFASLNETLKRTYQNKSELLLVLKHPDIPLHNNLSERDIREYVKKRKISGSTRSSRGRECRDTFTSIKKTCRKHGISFWEYIKDRVASLNVIPRLPEIIRAAV